MKNNPKAVFASIAALAAAALGWGAYYVNHVPPATPPQAVASGEAAAPTAAPAAPAATAEQPSATPPAQTDGQAAAPSEAPAAPAAQSTEQAAAPAATTGQAAAPAATTEQAAAPAAQPTAAPAAAGTDGNQQVAAATNPPATPAAIAPAEPDVSKPSFDSVRVEPTGEAVIAGRAPAGSEVTALLNGEAIGKAATNADGAFVIIPEKPLPAGSGALTLSISKDGKPVTSDDSVVVAVKENAPAMVAKVEPQAPTAVVQPAAASADAAPAGLQLNAVDYDDQGNIVFSGMAAAGSVIRFYVDNALSGEVTADAAGKWSFKGGQAVSVGTHNLRADAIGADGKVANRIELPFLRESAEAVAAAQAPAAQPPAAQTQADASQPAAAATPTTTTATQGGSSAAAEVTTPPAASGDAAAPASVAETAAQTGKIVIQPGNSLWRISRQIYGKGRMYTVIYEANRDQVRNPNRIYPGQILAAPKPAN